MKACCLLISGGFRSPILSYRRSVYQFGHKMLAPTQSECVSGDRCAASISKTDYILWRACAKNAWLRIHKPDVYYSTELTEYENSLMEMGIEVERVARSVFPDGTTITSSRTDALQETRLLIASNPRTLFQPVFELEGLVAFIDVLQCELGTGEWSIYEVKSATKAKEEHVYDLAFQVVLLRKHGIDIRRAFLILLNPSYVRQDDLDIQQLFNVIDITPNVADITETVDREMQDARNYLLNETEPSGPCSCIYKGRSRHCSTFHYSNPDVPGYGIHDIARIGSSPKKLKELVDAGSFALADIPSDIKLTKGQSKQLQAYRTGETIIDKEAIANELRELTFPLHFIDYETFASALPLFRDYSPYDQIPLQYSVHIVGSPDEEPIHRDFLHTGRGDPTRSFLDSLQKHVSPFGSLIAWNKAFECLVNDSIARRFSPAREYIIELNDRFYDLMDIFSKQYFVHRDLRGSVSIKKVLPVLTPELTYSNLGIQDGAMASLTWSRMISGEIDDQECGRLRSTLRDYCALDSYGMYAIWRALTNLIQSP
jgi:Domain of unknown function(DUF2779)/Domain of unknown function DUF83